MSAPQPDEELEHLLKRMELGELSVEEKDRLNRLLRDDEAALTRFIRYQRTDALLAWRFTPIAGVDERPRAMASMVGEAPVVSAESSARRDGEQRRGWLLAFAAALVGAIVGYSLATGMQHGSNKPPIVRLPQDVPVAKLTFMSHDVRWGVPLGQRYAWQVV